MYTIYLWCWKWVNIGLYFTIRSSINIIVNSKLLRFWVPVFILSANEIIHTEISGSSIFCLKTPRSASYFFVVTRLLVVLRKNIPLVLLSIWWQLTTPNLPPEGPNQLKNGVKIAWSSKSRGGCKNSTVLWHRSNNICVNNSIIFDRTKGHNVI